MPRFYIYVGEYQVAEVVKKFTFLYPEYHIDGLDWKVSGKIMSHEYSVFQHSEEIATIKKAWFTWGDSYEIDIADTVEQKYVLAVVLVIDCALEGQNSSRS